MFPVYDVSASFKDRPETLGSKEKDWLVPQSGLGLPAKLHLFKVGRPNTGENWAEKVCCEILKVLQIPAAEYHLAVRNGTQGVLSESFLPENARFFAANILLFQTDSTYDSTVRFRQTRYTLTTALDLFKLIAFQAPLGIASRYEDITAYEIFVGYLVFDVLVGNTDRHHENWGVIETVENLAESGYYLAPSFDHASSLGRDLSDKRRQERMNTKDMQFSVEAYAERARSAFFGTDRTLTGREVLEKLIDFAPGPTRMWSERVLSLEQKSLENIFEEIPREIMSEAAVQFAVRFIACNQRVIREVALA